MGFGEENHRVKCHFHYIILRKHAINMAYHDNVDLHHLAETVFVTFLHYKPTLFSPLHAVLFGIKTLYTAQT